jgi:hypothetical protein
MAILTIIGASEAATLMTECQFCGQELTPNDTVTPVRTEAGFRYLVCEECISRDA